MSESESRFRQLVETIRSVFWIAEEDRLVYVSPSYEAVWGRTRESLFANLMTFVEAVHPEDRTRVTSKLERQRRGETTAVEYRVVRPDGTVRWVSDRAYPVLKDGQPTGRVAGVAEDVTEQKRMLEETQRAKDEADAANRAKSAFLATMSHEIRTPLTAIAGFADLLLEPFVSDELRQRFAGTIQRNAKNLARLLDDILDLSKVEAGKLLVESVPVALSILLDDVVATLAAVAREKGIGMTVASAGVVPERIRSDPYRLRQILVNIIGNAVKFTDQGGVSITISHAPAAARGRLVITVADTGRGIAPWETDKLFQPFAQGVGNDARRSGGTGLGLALSRRLARLLGGDVVLERTLVGCGSTFVVTVDSGAAAAAADGGAPGESALAAPAVGKSDHLHGIAVLLVEDSADIGDLVVEMLSASGARVELARSGPEGIEKALSASFDVVLMDIQLPGCDGLEATKILRSKGYQQPIIALTAYAMKSDREQSLSVGCDDYLSKPVARSVLVQKIAYYAAADRARSNPSAPRQITDAPR